MTPLINYSRENEEIQLIFLARTAGPGVVSPSREEFELVGNLRRAAVGSPSLVCISVHDTIKSCDFSPTPPGENADSSQVKGGDCIK